MGKRIVLAVWFVMGSWAFSNPGPSLRVIPDQLYLPTLLGVLDHAKESIDVLQFSFAIADKDGKIETEAGPYKVAKTLIRLKKENPRLKIRLYIEGSRDTAERNRVTADYLASNGVEVKLGKTHAKGFAIDGKTLLLGSTNLTTQSLQYNNETNLLLENLPQVSQAFSGYYEKLWGDAAREPSVSPVPAENGIQLLTDGSYKNALLAAIAKATKTIDFSIYYFNEAEIEAALIAAHRRGVEVRGYLNQHKSYGLELVERNRKTVERLKAAGISKVYFDLDTFFSHSKYLIVDATTMYLGTGNWNRSDIEEHPQVYLKVESPLVAGKLVRHLSHQIAYESAREVPKRLYYRFWVGTKGDISLKDFDRVIAERFIRATVVTGEKGGLHGYVPVLLAPQGSAAPDEIALVIYQDEPTYRAIRESAVGSVYGPLHFDYFAKTSKSAEPAILEGKAEVGKAYDLSLENVNWQKGNVLFVYSPKDQKVEPKQVERYLKEVRRKQSELKVQGYTVLVGADYLVEFFLSETLWSEEQVAALEQLKKRNLVGSYLAPTHTEVARNTGFEENGLRRPDAGLVRQLTKEDTAGVINTLFKQSVVPELFLHDSLQSFLRSDLETEVLKEEIKKAFVEGWPVPTR